MALFTHSSTILLHESIQTSEHVQLLRNYVLDIPNELCL